MTYWQKKQNHDFSLANFMKNSIGMYCKQPLTPDLGKTSNVRKYTRMAPKSNSPRNFDLQAEYPKTIPHINSDNPFILLSRF